MDYTQIFDSPLILKTLPKLKAVIKPVVTVVAATQEEKEFQSCLAMMYSLIEEGRITDVYIMIAIGFSEHFQFPETEFYKRFWNDQLLRLKQDIDDGTILKKLFKK